MNKTNFLTAKIESEKVVGSENFNLPVPWWSFTKTVLAAASLLLVNEEKLFLDERLENQPFTLLQLLQHRAGVPDYGSLPEYQAAVTILNYRHVCRLQRWPAPLQRSMDGINMEIYGAMQGPNEFLYTGNLKDWNRIADMHRIAAPALIMVGRHDELPPSCALRMKNALPDAELVVFPNSSHTPFYEEPDMYYQVLLDFLGRQRSA